MCRIPAPESRIILFAEFMYFRTIHTHPAPVSFLLEDQCYSHKLRSRNQSCSKRIVAAEITRDIQADGAK